VLTLQVTLQLDSISRTVGQLANGIANSNCVRSELHLADKKGFGGKFYNIFKPVLGLDDHRSVASVPH
jgi:hypothetical protein